MTAEADMYGHETTTERPAPGSASPPAPPSTHRCGGVLVHGSALDCGTCASPPAGAPPTDAEARRICSEAGIDVEAATERMRRRIGALKCDGCGGWTDRPADPASGIILCGSCPASPPARAERYLPGAPHAEPSDCPTYYDGCHCTVEALTHNITRAASAEARAEAAEKHAERAEAHTRAAREIAAEHVTAESTERRRAEAAERELDEWRGRATVAEAAIDEFRAEKCAAEYLRGTEELKRRAAESALSALREGVVKVAGALDDGGRPWNGASVASALRALLGGGDAGKGEGER